MSNQELPAEKTEDIFKERTSLRVYLLSLAVFVVGLFLLLTANGWDWLKTNHTTTTVVIKDIGALLVATVAITLLWELAAKRALLSELMSRAKASLEDLIAKTKLAEEVRGAKLTTFTNDFWYGVNWLELFRNVKRLDLFFSYARSWMNSHTPQLQALAKRPGARIRVILPDPDDNQLMTYLAQRFSNKPEEVRNNIENTKKDLLKIFVEPFSKSKNLRPPDFSLYYLAAAPLFTFYRFDHEVVLAMYKHRPGRGGIPILIGEEGGTIFEFVMQEIEAFTDEKEGLTRRIYPVLATEEAHDPVTGVTE